MGKTFRREPEVDLQVLQAQVIAQGLLLKAIAKSIDDTSRVRTVFAEEMARMLPSLSAETMAFVSVHANNLLLQFHKPAAGQNARLVPADEKRARPG